MKQLITLISALFFLTIGVSQVWALPACPSSGYFDNCYGTNTWADGSKYVGEWKNNKRTGQGTLTLKNGDRFVGSFRNGDRNGKGIFSILMEKKSLGNGIKAHTSIRLKN